MKGKSNFGYKFLFFIALVATIASAAARDRGPFDYDEPDPQPDTPAKATPPDSAHTLRFPIYDNTGNPAMDQHPKSMDLNDPPNLQSQVDYDPSDSGYYFKEKLGDHFLSNPSYMTMDDYVQYQGKKDEQAYWQRRLDALTLFNKKPELPTMYKEGIFDRIFGGTAVSVKPQGNVDVTFGGNWQNIKNPTLVQRAQKYGIFNFDMQMNVNLVATVGDKLKLNISNNTKATFDYQNMQKLEYTGKEDEILKKIEAGNISFPLKSSLITGVQSLFGIKAQLQFGKLWVTAALAQQKSQRKSATIQGGAQTQQFAIKIDNYEENRNFLLGQYFHDNYNKALKDYPVINSTINISKIEVWVTNRTGTTAGVRDALAFMDLGERDPYATFLQGGGSLYPTNTSNRLYELLSARKPLTRQPANATANASLDKKLEIGKDFERATMRQLSPSEFTFNAQLGYISLNTQMNSDDVLGVAYRYTRNGQVYQVGDFAEDLPPDSTNPQVLWLKLLKGTSSRPTLPIWKLMMKNIYALGGLGVSKDNFQLNILYQDPGGGEKRYLPEGPNAGVPLLSLLNLDKLNSQGSPQPDGIFDFVDGITVNTQQGKIIFPVLEPFGRDLSNALGNNPVLMRKYLYNILYDSTKVVAQQFQQNDRYILRGSYKSSSSSEIFLGGFNIPQGSVVVTAGGTRLVEGQDYQIDYGLGRLKILNTGILNSGIPINVQYEDNSTFGFQQQNFMGARFDYFVNKKLTLGGTFMRLTERPFTQKVSFGEDPIKNIVLGADANYQSEFPALTRALDKLPMYSTSAPSFINASGEVATLLPGHAKQINTLDKEGSVYIDDFEGTTSTYDLKLPAIAWTLSSTPAGGRDKNGIQLFPEASDRGKLTSGINRAKLAWYFIEPTLEDATTGIPDYVKKDPNQHYIRLIQQQDVFPQKSYVTLQNGLSTLDLAFYPKDRGPYNFDATNVNPDGSLQNPQARWGGITRPIENTDFEQANVEYIQFWMMDPFINNPSAKGGSLYFNLGDVSEDVLKDARLFFENGIPYPKDKSKLDTTIWGYVPKFEQQITRSFDNDPAARLVQDVGYDGSDDDEENAVFESYINAISSKVDPAVLAAIKADPANDDYHHYRGADYDQLALGILGRYKRFNNPQGNSPVTSAGASFSSAATTLPESEDINRDNALNESENYFQYRVDLGPNMNVGSNYIVNKQVTPSIKLPNGTYEAETWYQFKIPIKEFTQRVGNIADFRSIRFMRMFLNGFQDSVILRFATLELGRNQWRQYQYSLMTPGEVVPQQNTSTTNFAITSVSVEENTKRTPVPYVIPPGVNRQQISVSNGQTAALNEQSLSLQICALADGDARAVYKEVNVDMRQFDYLRMFIHAESKIGEPAVNDGDLRAFVRIGSDFTSNYYEYDVPLVITPPGVSASDINRIWPDANIMNIVLNDLVNAKLERDKKGWPAYVPYTTKDSKGKPIIIVGNPTVANAKNLMMGVINPKKDNQNPGDDGIPKCVEVWFDELRMAGTNDKEGYAAAGKVTVQMADLGNVNLSGGMHTQGYGNIDQKIQQRFQDNFYQYAASTNLSVGKLLPRNWGIQLPLFVGYTENVSVPKYNPYDQDVKLTDAFNNAKSSAERDSLKKAAEDFTSITSMNLSNVRILGSPEKQSKTAMPWTLRNFDFSLAYSKQLKHNPTIAEDKLTNTRFGLGYAYSLKARSFEPFKRVIRSKSKWFSLVKDFNINPVPSNFSFRTDMNRILNATTVRNVDDGTYQIPTTFYKNFSWTRLYTLRWELTRSLSFDYTATNTSVIDEPYGYVKGKAKQDSLIEKIGTFGRNTLYTQTFNASYNVPLQKLPITDWINLRASYGANYTWTASTLIARQLGNTIGNTQTKQLNGDLNFVSLYNKMRWYRGLSQPSNKVNAPQNILKGQSQNPISLIPGKKDEVKKGGKKDVDTNKQTVTFKYKNQLDSIIANAKNLSDKQLDSLKQLQRKQELAQKKADKLKRKQDRIAARKKRRATTPNLSPIEKAAGRIVTMLQRAQLNYTENSGTILPGYMDSTNVMGVNPRSNFAPGFDFVYGYQPNSTWLQQQANAGRLSRDSIFNSQFQQTYSQNISVTATLQPINDLRIDLSLTQTFSKSHSELFKDTGTGTFSHLNPYESGSFNISYVSLNTMFKESGAGSGIYNQFLDNRTIISNRLGKSNPYTNGTPDPNNPIYAKGYTQYSQDVLLPAFIAAYTGKSASSVALIDYSNPTTKSNPFKYYTPLPNWRLTYNGLSRLPLFSNIFSNFVINHSYTGSMSMNGFATSLLYRDLYGLGFPSFIDSGSGNYVPFFQVPNVTISQQFNPLIGIDVALRNNMTGHIEVRKAKTQSLSMIDYQVAETNSTEYVIGGGYRVKNVRLPFPVFGVQRLKNELNIKLDISLRNDVSTNNYLAQNIGITSRGQKVLRISPSIDYMVNNRLTLHLFYDRQQTIPYVSSSYPITTTQAGITLRFIFAQ